MYKFAYSYIISEWYDGLQDSKQKKPQLTPEEPVGGSNEAPRS
jgi:hypothetical protein